MSYCRFSSDDFRCNFYAYGDSSGGYVLHVAASRVNWEPPERSPYRFDETSDMTEDEFRAVHEEYHRRLQDSPRSNISLPGAGETFRFDTLREMRDRMKELIDLGFRAPDWLLPSLEGEIEEEEAGR